MPCSTPPSAAAALEVVAIRHLVASALAQAYGVVGAAHVEAEVEAYEPATGVGMVSFAGGQDQYLRAALAAVTAHQGTRLVVTLTDSAPAARPP
jgi:RNase P/RNase MRP subunit POP5